MGINLTKRAEKVSIILDKRDIKHIPCQVKLAIDRSGSMSDLYDNGTVQDIVERVLAIGMNFDVDKSIDVWAFTEKSVAVTAATESNIDGYVNNQIVKKVGMGGTSYAPVMLDIIKNSKDSSKKPGFFSKLFGKKSDDQVYPSLAIFITDGENDDPLDAEDAIYRSQNENIYWVLIGIGKSTFRSIQHLGDRYPNAGFLPINNISAIDDDDLYNGILCEEFAQWITKFK